MNDWNVVLQETLQLLVEKCPRLVAFCYWGGTAAIALEELHHRESFDLDFHTRQALLDVRPILAEMQSVFGDDFEMLHAPDDFGSGFLGVLTLPSGNRINVEVLSNYQDVEEDELVPSSSAKGLSRVSLSRYLADKIQCVLERCEARDLVDIRAVLLAHPEMQDEAKRLVANQDCLLLAERLLSWSDADLEEDLRSYRDANAKDAMEARDLLTSWLKPDSRSEDTTP